MPPIFPFTEATHEAKLRDVSDRKTYTVLREHPSLQDYWQTVTGNSYHKYTGAPHPNNEWPPQWLDTMSVKPIERQ